MITDYSERKLISLLKKQLLSFFDFEEELDLYPYVCETLSKIDLNFSNLKNKYYHKDQNTFFSPYHSCQYLVFLYTLSNTLYKSNVDSQICTKIYYLNKIMHSIDIYYEIDLPAIWFCDHPLGTVLGRANYSNYFSFLQGCTVGNNKGIYPSFGEHVMMFSNSSVIGNCNIGNNVIIGANTNIKDEDIDDNCLVFGNSPNLIIKKKNDNKSFFDRYYF